MIAIAFALGICTLATRVGFDRDRGLYPTASIVIASYHAPFAVTAGPLLVRALEGDNTATFAFVPVAGFRRSLYLVVAGLAAHPVLDVFHARLIADSGVPS